MPDELCSYLIEIGLTETEAKIYLTLLDHNKLTAKEIAKITGIFRTHIYDVLKNLVEKGFCTEIIDKVKNYVPIDPELALKGLVTGFERKVRLTKNLSLQLHQMFLSNLDCQQNQEKMIEVLYSDIAIRKRLKESITATQKELFSFNKPLYNLRYNADRNKLLNCDDLGNAQVRHRAIFQIDIDNMEMTLQVANKAAEKGEEVRIARYLPIRMMIFDNSKVFYQLSADRIHTDFKTGIFISHLEMAITFINSFWFEWQRSISLEEFKQKLEENNITQFQSKKIE